MPNLTLWPLGTVLEIDSEHVLLEQLRKSGQYIKSTCGGHASCGDCVVKITSGEDKISPQGFAELKLLGNIFHITKERLSCQTKCSGDVTIDISGHQKGDDQSRLMKKTSDMRNKNQKKKTSVLKKSEQVNREALVKMDKQAQDEKNAVGEKKDPWFKHWENKDDPNAKDPAGFKRLDGNNRPKMFKTPEPELEGAEGQPAKKQDRNTDKLQERVHERNNDPRGDNRNQDRNQNRNQNRDQDRRPDPRNDDPKKKRD